MLGSSMFSSPFIQTHLQLESLTLTHPNVAFKLFKQGDSRLITVIKRRQCLASAHVRNGSSFSTEQKQVIEKDDEDETEEDEGKNEEANVEAEMFGESKGSYEDMTAFLDGAFKDDREIQEIIENSFEDPEEMGKRVNERIKRKEKDILQAKTGSSVPMKVSFCDFDATDSYIWMELYSGPSEKDIDIIGSALRSWYVLGCLGGYNSLNTQLTKIPVNERLTYKEYKDDDFLPARFVNVGELEFQHNWGRFWVDLGTSDPLALDVLVNTLSSISSDYLGIKQVIFGGKDVGRWNEEITSEEEGHVSFKI
ncbi:hypothetical protein GOP47_0020646 [Adiantum capillus-veneris]|uniref:Uncharacterized protein n=1 Tax=Adiantum capillus-veneris TaxID=13818 RepID=A0A9D4UBF9_ADICA|nr:hypothetical protein GOP47_0020646 [Adiantum capillus-veneris]